MRDSILWSIGTGTLLGLFQYTRTHNIQSMINYTFTAGGVAGVCNYILCRSQYKRQRDTARFYMQHQDELKQYVEQQRLNKNDSEIQTTMIQPNNMNQQSTQPQIR